MAIRSRQREAIAFWQLVIDTAAVTDSSVAELAQREGLVGYALITQSWYFGRLGQFDKQISCIERSRATVHQYGTPYEVGIYCHFDASSRTDPEAAQVLYEQSLAILREIGATWEVAFSITGMGHVAFGRGEALEARALYAEALALWQASGEFQGTSNALLSLGRVAYTLGNYDEGRRLLEESLAMQQAVGSKIRIVECHELLGEIAAAQGQFAEAEACFRRQLAIVPDLGYREQLSWCLSHLGAAVLAQERLDEAAGLLAEALSIAEQCNDPRGIARAHNQLGYLALRQGARDTAGRHWRMAIDLAWRVQDRPHLLVALDALIGLATLMAQAGDVERAVELLALVRGAAHIDRRTETKAEQLLAELEVRLSPTRFAATQARGRALELGATVAALLAEGAA
jgi:tetratricopeptide (TPR) repeat protein